MIKNNALYFLDFGKCFKIGVTTNFSRRINGLQNTLKDMDLHINDSFYFDYPYYHAYVIEHFFKRKYKNLNYHHPKIKEELFENEAKEMMLDDLRSYNELLLLNVKPISMKGDFVEYIKNGEKKVIQKSRYDAIRRIGGFGKCETSGE